MPWTWPWQKRDRVTEMVREVGEEIAGEVIKRTTNELRGLSEARTLHDTIRRLKEEAEKLKLEKDRRDEDIERREREIQHKLGLHKTQVTHEMGMAKREATIDLKEDALKDDRKRFQDQMNFQRRQLEDQVKRLEKLMGKIIDRLPSAEFTADLGKIIQAREERAASKED